MAQCNIVTCVCIFCACLQFLFAAGAYYFIASFDFEQVAFEAQMRIAMWGSNATEKAFMPVGQDGDGNDWVPVYDVYYKKEDDDTDCSTLAAQMKVRWSCGPSSIEPDCDSYPSGDVKNLKVVCEERESQSTGETYVKALSWDSYTDGTGFAVEGNYTVEAPLAITVVFLNTDMLDQGVFFFAMATVTVGAVCGGICCCIGVIVAMCSSSGEHPAAQPQVQMQQQQQPMQQPMVQPQYGQYGQPMQQPMQQPQYGQYETQ